MFEPCKGCLVQPMCTKSENCIILKKKIDQLNFIKETASIFVFVGLALFFALASYYKGYVENSYAVFFVVGFILFNMSIVIYFTMFVDVLKDRYKGHKI